MKMYLFKATGKLYVSVSSIIEEVLLVAGAGAMSACVIYTPQPYKQRDMASYRAVALYTFQ